MIPTILQNDYLLFKQPNVVDMERAL